MTAGEWARLRTSADVVLLDGFHAVKHALRFGAEVLSVVTADRQAALSLAATLAPDLVEALAARLKEVDAATFAQLCGAAGSSGAVSGHRTGVAALARRAHWTFGPLASAERTAPLVFLDGPRHLGNYGAVIRVAAGLGASGVVSTGTVDPWHPTVLRGAAGLHYALPVARVTGPPADRPLIALHPEGEELAALPADATLAFGTERDGLSDALLARADGRVRIPMRPGVSSLNLATAVAVALYSERSGFSQRSIVDAGVIPTDS